MPGTHEFVPVAEAQANSGAIAGIYTIKDLRLKFKQLDKDSDGYLSCDEMVRLLRRGNPGITDAEMRALWADADNDHDDAMDFDEFLDYLFGQYDQKKPADWKGAKKTLLLFAKDRGKSEMLDEREWVKLCHTCQLFDHDQFGIPDAGVIFKEVKGAHGRAVDFKGFKKLLKAVAQKKNMSLKTLVAWVAAFAPGRTNEEQAQSPNAGRPRKTLT
mmetsp:Transcript_11492/g.20328  ORF Transcript_11492/g.20328 Transcript_11492/m.20328 type:complete len:215 (+) Transcript_11492:50-694(+)